MCRITRCCMGSAVFGPGAAARAARSVMERLCTAVPWRIGSIVAAGAVVTEGVQIPPGSLVAGVPGRVRRALGEADHELIRSYARNYVDYTAMYLKEVKG